MTLGISFSIKSNLGVSPVSSIPYMITLILGVEMGKATTLFQAFLILLQILILRRNFKLINLSQLVVAFIFGNMTTFSNGLMAFVPVPETMAIRILMLMISILLVAVGIFLYMPADIMPMAPEGFVQAVSNATGIALPKGKVIFDVTLVSIAGIFSLIVLSSFGSVGVGTIFSALLTGTALNFIMKLLGEKLKGFLYSSGSPVPSEQEVGS